MEAPEKLYFNTSDINGILDIYSNKDPHDSLEYTRTEVFIEKIENYLNSQLYGWVSVTNPDQRSYPYIIPKKDFIDDLKNYMKGE